MYTNVELNNLLKKICTEFMATMALSSSSSLLPLSSFSVNSNSRKISRSCNAQSMAVRSSLYKDSDLLLQAAKYTVISLYQFSKIFEQCVQGHEFTISSFACVNLESRLMNDSWHLVSMFVKKVDSFVESGMVIGLGSGRASGYAIQYLGRQLRSGAVRDITAIPT